MWAKRVENFHGLEINFGKLLLVYFMRLPMEALGVVGQLALFAPSVALHRHI